jgi:LysR family transcriptional regulator, mexEF-oprN operon transcriptional activator
MMTINKNDLRGFDLNLLPVFLTLMQERSLTRAAQALNIGQPAASAALKRLREALNDELFLRTPTGMQPTSRASELARVLQPLMADILGALQTRRPFDPAREVRVFRLGMLGNHEYFLMPRLLKRLRKSAPGIRLVVQPILKHAASRMLNDGEIDLACGRIREISKWQSSIPLVEIGYKCLFDGKRLKMKAPISMKKFLDMPHLLFSPNGELEGVVDQALALINKHRKVIYATSFFSALPALLKQVDAIVTLPEYTAVQFADDYGLTISPTPIAIPKYHTSLVWQSQVTDDPAHVWLRKQIQDVVSEIGKRVPKK